VGTRSRTQRIPICAGRWRFFLLPWCWLLLAAVFFVGTAFAGPAQIEFILSEDSGAYVETVTALRQELGDKVPIIQTNAAALERGEATSESALVVTFGTRAFKAALAGRAGPLVAALITQQAFDETLRETQRPRDPKSVSAVYLDQPIGRHFDLVRAVLPGRSRIGVLISAGDTESVKLLDAAARAHGLKVSREVVTAPRDIFPALTKLLANCDVVLATPDPRIYNGATLHNILLATYREGRPLFGFSPAYVRAGALAAVYSTPQHMARQLAGAVQRVLAGSGVPPAQYPQLYSVKVNQTVARSLGFSVGDEHAIEGKLQALERER
jgi:putative tryptophan/tyrosine transport system substrate-binding protein